MDDPTRTVMDELARTSGVVGVERLAALFTRREPEAAKTMSKTEVRQMANDVLKVKPDKQILQYPKERSGGAIHASEPLRSALRIVSWLKTQTSKLSHH